MKHQTLLQTVHQLYTSNVREPSAEALGAVEALLVALEAGEVRAAEPRPDGSWAVIPEVKEGILVAFRIGRIAEFVSDAGVFSDKHTFAPRRMSLSENNIRVVPGGSSARRGSFLGRDVTCMPPMFINVGAFVDDGTMVDSHALVGSCAQIGKNVHLSAAAQIGGVLEPIGMRPVIIENNALIGGNCGVYEGTLVRERAVLAAGVVLTGSTRVFDLVRETVYSATADAPLEIPAGALVVPGSRPVVNSAFGREHGLHLYCPVIVKYRDEKTDLRAALEGDLR